MHLSDKLFNATNGGRDIILDLLDSKARQLAERGRNFCYGPNDKNPSVSLYKNRDHIWMLHDHGGDVPGGNAISVYAYHYGLDWTDALLKLATQYHLLDGAAAKKWGQAEYKSRAAKEGEVAGWFTFVKRDFVESDYTTIFAPKTIEFCKQNVSRDANGEKYAYTKRMGDVFAMYNFIAVESYRFCSEKDNKLVVHTFEATPEYPIYVYDMGTWAKVYQPFARDKKFRFMHLGKKPEGYIFGLDLLAKKYSKLIADENDKRTQAVDTDGKEIKGAPQPNKEAKLSEAILCTGGSDGMNVAVFGYNAIWANSETGKELTLSVFTDLEKWCTDVYQLPDIDATGRKVAHKLAYEYLTLKTIKLPKELANYRDNRGGKCKDVKDYFKYYNKTHFGTLLRQALPYRFWDAITKYNKEGDIVGTSYECNNTHLYNFLMSCGFYQFKANNGQTDMFIKITGNIVKEIEPKMIRGFINSFLEERKFNTDLRNVFFRTTQLNASSMENLGYIELEFKPSGKNHQYFFFEDCTYEVRSNEIIEHAPGDIDVYTWEEHVIKHKMKNRLKPAPFELNKVDENWTIEIKHRECLFFRYLENTTKMHWRVEKQGVEIIGPDGVKHIRKEYTEEELAEHRNHLLNRLFTIGYMCHRYKSASRAWAVWAQENQVIENSTSEGGSGKSILANSFKFIMGYITIGARDSRITDNKHLFENVTEKHAMVHFDDCGEYLDFQFFFPRITGDFDVNPKNTRQFSLPFEISPKLYFSSNYAPRANDGSSLRRLLFTVFSDYYHHGPSEIHASPWSPRDEFGKELFRDFTDAEWEYFYTVIMHCTMFYLSCDASEKIDPPRNIIEQRSLLAAMANNFYDWAVVYFSPEGENLNKELEKKEALMIFNAHVNGKLAMNKFTASLKAFCKLMGYTYNPESKVTDKKNKRIIRNLDIKGTTEMFYIEAPDNTAPLDMNHYTPPTQEQASLPLDNGEELPF